MSTTPELPEFKEEFDFRDLVRQPWKLLGYSYGYFLLAVFGVGMVYVTNLSEIGLSSVPPQVLADSSASVKDIPYQAPAVIPPVDVNVVGHPSDSLLALGREVFKANCVSCHGDNGLGDGPGGAALNPKPRNFHQTANWTNGPKVSQIYRTLEEGIVKNGMASYNYLPARSRFALAHLIRTWVPAPPQDTDAELQQLETIYQLSKGQVRPAQIPVQRATALVVRENDPVERSVMARVAAAAASDDRGAVVLRRMAFDPVKVVASFTVHAAQLGRVEEFARIVSGDPLKVGFRAGMVNLTSEEWSALFQYLRTLSSVGQR